MQNCAKYLSIESWHLLRLRAVREKKLLLMTQAIKLVGLLQACTDGLALMAPHHACQDAAFNLRRTALPLHLVHKACPTLYHRSYHLFLHLLLLLPPR